MKNKEQNQGLGTISSAVSIVCTAVKKTVLRRVTLSKPSASGVIRTELSLMKLGGENALRCVSYMKDGKAIQKNIRINDELQSTLNTLFPGYSQINIMTTLGDCEFRRSRSGREVLLGGYKLERELASADPDNAPKVEAEGNDRQKQRILRGDEPFLRELGIASANISANGKENLKVHDKKQPKFRQICRFLEYVRDIEDQLPREGVLRICDLCCGKSYLSFAVYHYFAVIRGRQVEMTGVDLKPDVIEYCSAVAGKLGFDGLRFICGNVLEYEPEQAPHLVVSLHACDVATDIVLHLAAKWRTRVILSTPCCQHELAGKINCAELEFVTGYPILRRKLCDALTDSLRLLYLRSEGYSVNACELVDPDDTPKNILLRAILRHDFDYDGAEAERLRAEYVRTRELLIGEGNCLMGDSIR